MDSPKNPKPLSEIPSQGQTIKLNPKARSDLVLSNNSRVLSQFKRKPLVLSTTPRANLHVLEKAKQLKTCESSKIGLTKFTIKPILKTSILNFPVSPAEVLTCFPDLPEWVKDELAGFDSIYFFSKAHKNFAQDFDDVKGDYRVLNGDDFFYRFELQEMLGKGSFGLVVKAFDHLDKRVKALKIVKNNERFQQQSENEICILNQLADLGLNDFVVKIEESFVFRSHMVMVFELLGINLYELIKRNLFRGLSTALIKKFTHQILGALSSLRQQNIIHCDLKPENILVSDSQFSSVKLIDFGSSCFTNQQVYTYIQSRFYRAPEIVLGARNYSPAIDIWSFGCILVELYTGIPLFPAENEKELICRIVELLGDPPAEMLKGHRSHLFFESNGKLKVESRRTMSKRNLKAILKAGENGFVELVSACLKWNPEERVSPDEALMSYWLGETGEGKKKLKISIDDITKHTPQLKKFIAGRNNTLK